MIKHGSLRLGDVVAQRKKADGPDYGVHGGHHVVPHRHVPVEGVVKPCSGRFRCESCRVWFAGPLCHEEGK